MSATSTPVKIADLKPGDRVRCYDAFSATVVRTVDTWLGAYAVVDYDHDQGQTSVFEPYIQSA